MGSNTTLEQSTRREQQAWGQSDSIAFYTTHRSSPEDLYPSERKFLPDVLSRAQNCLDFGCAAGGFSSLMHHFNPALQYTGVDVIPEFIQIARARHPESRFFLIDGVGLPFQDDAFDLVHSSGVLHLNSAHREIVRELYRVCRRYLLADFRLTRGPERVGTCRLSFQADTGASPDTETPLPYVVLNVDEHLAFLKNLIPPPRSIQAFGYYREATDMAQIDLDRILMAFFLIEKGRDEGRRPEVMLDFE
jgi:SAM-dependent methyltransferase